MDGHLERRQTCVNALRRALGEDPHLFRYALLYAVECLDLRQVNNLVEAVENYADEVVAQRNTAYSGLVRERFQPEPPKGTLVSFRGKHRS